MIPSNLTIARAHQGLIKKEFSAVELCQAFLDKIKKEDKKIGAFLTLNENQALLEARKIDDLISQKREIPILAGIPLAIKDNILVKDLRATAGSRILENYIAPYSATVIKKLKSQGAIILGKANLDEFAMGSSGENSGFFKTKNPRDLSRVPGGSSSGSAAAVTADFCCAALGSDTGGSIRLPASFCGIVGLKPTYGAVSRYGLIAMASSLDQIGPLSKTVEDSEILFGTISGKDPQDSTSLDPKIFKPPKEKKPEAFKIGLPKEYFIGGLKKEIKEILDFTIKKLKDFGLKIEEISLPHTEYALPTYYIIVPSEVSANLARYDGIKYGRSKVKEKIKNLIEVYFKTRQQYLGEEPRRRILLGSFALSSGYYEAYYLRAQKVRTLIGKDFERAFKKVDLILTPTSPTPAFKIGEKQDPLAMYLSDIFLVAVNLAGLPAISLPVSKEGLPIGVQFIAPPFLESRLFKIGKILEKI